MVLLSQTQSAYFYQTSADSAPPQPARFWIKLSRLVANSEIKWRNICVNPYLPSRRQVNFRRYLKYPLYVLFLLTH
jgi:hypothetical protein